MEIHSAVRTDTLVYAETREGIRMPVIDVTNPRFSIPDDPAALARLKERLEASEHRRRFVPGFILRCMIRSAARKSRLVQSLFAVDNTYLDGLSTYVMKLGAKNLLPPYDSAVDRRFASSPHVTYLRLRTQQMATLMADALASELAEQPRAPLHLINIGGGPAIDSLNALILLSRLRDALVTRKSVIHVLDPDDAGAFFGRNALAAMKEKGRPLAGLDIDFRHMPYDWNDTGLLKSLLGEITADPSAVSVASSEGALFEYGSDDAIVADLNTLRAARFVVGSVTRADEARQRLVAGTRFTLILRGLEKFTPLAARAGFDIVKSYPTIWSDQVLMRPK